MFIVSADTLILAPVAPTLVHAEYRTCTEDIPPEILAGTSPKSSMAQLLKLLPL